MPFSLQHLPILGYLFDFNRFENFGLQCKLLVKKNKRPSKQLIYVSLKSDTVRDELMPDGDSS